MRTAYRVSRVSKMVNQEVIGVEKCAHSTAFVQKKANFHETIGVYSCEFVVNLKKQSQFARGQNTCKLMYDKGLRENRPV